MKKILLTLFVFMIFTSGEVIPQNNNCKINAGQIKSNSLMYKNANNKLELLSSKKDKNTKSTVKPKNNIITDIKDAAVRGFGWGLGKEAAKETVKGIKDVIKKQTEKSDNKKKDTINTKK